MNTNALRGENEHSCKHGCVATGVAAGEHPAFGEGGPCGEELVKI